ncbi:UTP--glucose-1-phosphate uridylyltransferase GalU [Clostridiaceae bacterium DONG20-135]|uniref:UTP--glucose-1-phosphate uridylyltransferase n=1 Tax=Copranaerobaculum intestinale TaxID=2692629 RepID=A0A6N8U4H2_9FIRM|nr:UTP--glucose-1-phosphate uridylyltransferase GalU [Copranaerobaculum intestinale]MXQ72781.1 UTP--glucose-1-phosphate uridylyltransferase GalU [Copranaerobaculum intestinale]
MKKIRKAIIPAAGFGTRFLPATKAVPKEMLPIVDKPTIQYIVEEAVKSGIEEILIITNAHKASIENHFDQSFELEKRLDASHSDELLTMCRDISNMANIYSVRQKNPRGLGHAVLCAKTFVGDEPFAILLGDDIVVNKNGPTATEQLVRVYEEQNASVVGVQRVADEAVHKYGIIDPKASLSDRCMKVQSFVEKPKLEDAPSNMAILGRYILTPKIFELLETQEPGSGNEIQLTDAIDRLTKYEEVYAYDFIGSRYDVGDKIGFIKAQIDFALDRADLHEQVAAIIRDANQALK